MPTPHETIPSNEVHQLKRALNHYQSMYHEAPIGSVTICRDGTILQANKAAKELLSKNRESIDGTSIVQYIVARDQDRFEAFRQSLFGATGAESCDLQIEDSNQAILYIHLVGTASTDHLGEAIFQLVVLDITSRKEFEIKLIESERRLRDVLDATLDGVWDWDMSSGRVSFSAQWCRLLDYEHHEVPSRVEFFYQILHPAEVEQTQYALEQHFSGKTSMKQQEVRLRTKSGKYKWFLDRGKVVERDPSGNPIRMVGTITDISERKGAEAALIDSERELRLIANQFPGPMSRVNRDQRYLFVNDYYEKFFGKGRSEVIGRSISDVVSPDLYRQLEPHISTVLQGQRVTFETAYVCVSGTRRNTLVHYIPDLDADNTSIGFFILGIDITERKIAEAALLESSERLEKIAGRVPGAVYQFRLRPDGTGYFPYASDKLGSLLAVPPELVSKDAANIFASRHSEDHDALIASIHHSAVSLQPWNHEFRIVLPDGSQRWISGNSLPERESDGGTLWHGYFSDITDRKKADFELHQAAEKLEQAQSLARMGNWSVDKRTGEHKWSKQLYQLLGRDPIDGPPVYPDVLDCFHPDDQSELSGLFLAAINKGESYSIIVRTNGVVEGVRFVRCEGRSSRDQAGNVVDVFGTVTDVTQEFEREEALTKARRQAEAASLAKSEFLANMSHEIRTPLTAILGFTELLKEEGDSGLSRGERLNTLDTITVAGNHLLTIINDILDLSKIEADRTTIERVDTSLMALLFEIEGLNSKRAIGKGVSLELQLATAVPDRILTDPTRLRQILMNLVGNAIKFTEQGSVIVSVRELDFNGKYALAIDVKDTGRGMSQDQVERLFQPFAQADNTVTRTHGGTGLGLNISRRLAQLMEGDVFLMQTEIGKGSCFRLMLPIELSQGAVRVEHIDKSRPIPPVEVEQPPCKLSGRILLAEDGVDNQKLISFHLTKAGASVSIASNGQIALQMMQDANQQGRPFDLLLTDISMPELDGYELVRRLRAMGCKIPVVALTAHALAEDRDRCLEAGCDDYQSKPIVKRDLLETCKRWLLEKPS